MKELREEIGRLRRSIVRIARERGVAVAAASTHPFSTWSSQEVTRGERYTQLHSNMAQLARRMLIFGMHIHVGIEDKELLIDVMNQARYFLPHILALSTSSPFWQGRETGLKSYRTTIFESLPRTGIPPSLESWADYTGFIDTLIHTKCIDEPTKIWWDMRPHPKFPTLEFRVCDICTQVDDAVCIAAIVQAIVAKMMKLRDEQHELAALPPPPDHRKQVAGGALRHPRQPDRFRQAGRGDYSPSWPTSCSSWSTTWSTSSARARRSSTSTLILDARHQRRPPGQGVQRHRQLRSGGRPPDQGNRRGLRLIGRRGELEERDRASCRIVRLPSRFFARYPPR